VKLRESDAQAIRRLPLFSQVSDETFSFLTEAAFLQRFPPHVVLIREGEMADFLHIVVDGLVELYAAHGRRETTLGLVRPVDTFILAAVATDRVYLKSARTLEPTQILMVPAEAIRATVEREPAFAMAVMEELASRYREIVRELKNQKLRPGLERLAAWLLGAEVQAGGTGAFRLAFEKRLLASRLGMTPENLSRGFASLVPYGVVVKGRDVTLENREELARLAQRSPLIDNPKTLVEDEKALPG
jgi:CRP/FNR family transcriptional regulator, transcriptional activator FtrB